MFRYGLSRVAMEPQRFHNAFVSPNALSAYELPKVVPISCAKQVNNSGKHGSLRLICLGGQREALEIV